MGSHKWSVINSILYTMCFTRIGMEAFELCLATLHTELDRDPGTRNRLSSIEVAMLILIKKQDVPKSQIHPVVKYESCRKWSGSGCTLPQYRYSHTYTNCGDDHLVTKCDHKEVKGR